MVHSEGIVAQTGYRWSVSSWSNYVLLAEREVERHDAIPDDRGAARREAELRPLPGDLDGVVHAARRTQPA